MSCPAAALAREPPPLTTPPRMMSEELLKVLLRTSVCGPMLLATAPLPLMTVALLRVTFLLSTLFPGVQYASVAFENTVSVLAGLPMVEVPVSYTHLRAHETPEH